MLKEALELLIAALVSAHIAKKITKKMDWNKAIFWITFEDEIQRKAKKENKLEQKNQGK